MKLATLSRYLYISTYGIKFITESLIFFVTLGPGLPRIRYTFGKVFDPVITIVI